MPTHHTTLTINRVPVLTLWASVVAERLGFERDEALTLGRAVAGLNAYVKGASLGLFEPPPATAVERIRALIRERFAKLIAREEREEPETEAAEPAETDDARGRLGPRPGLWKSSLRR